ncbi:very long chain fatty acid elongase 2 isoform 2-T2 [Dama dama]|uniref:elongation of very long chain fatty acids protein 2 isoform X2 n=1 Tax=Dama dama TaxID=30532 RepID=UPI002A35A174|nr:elongation of very long chain fatty acids protein 2 isoform X2 [Dama dama]
MAGQQMHEEQTCSFPQGHPHLVQSWNHTSLRVHAGRAYSVQLGRRLQPTVSGSDQCRGGRHPARVLWWYYFSKLIEFLDTIFFVLRKKTSQITFLHVYHHASMFNIWWCVLNWIPCGQSFFGPTLNSFIHVLMYSYYGLSVFPSMHKHLWWKKYLTQAQLVQFLLTITHTMSAVVRPCGFPFGCLIFQSSYMMTLVILFLNFYIQTYRKKPMKKAMEEAGKEVKNGFSKAYFSAANGVISKKAQ